MHLTCAGVEPFSISTSQWDDALDLASHYGWDRAVKEVNFGGSDDRKDAFRFGWGQSITKADVKDLAGSLRQASTDKSSEATIQIAKLAAFFERCAGDVILEQ